MCAGLMGSWREYKGPRSILRVLLCLLLLWLCVPIVFAFPASNPLRTMQRANAAGTFRSLARSAQMMHGMQVRFARRAADAVGPASEARKRVLVVVESPTKAGTIGKYLADQPAKYVVQSTMGHLRDLLSPSK